MQNRRRKLTAQVSKITIGSSTCNDRVKKRKHGIKKLAVENHSRPMQRASFMGVSRESLAGMMMARNSTLSSSAMREQ